MILANHLSAPSALLVDGKALELNHRVLCGQEASLAAFDNSSGRCVLLAVVVLPGRVWVGEGGGLVGAKLHGQTLFTPVGCWSELERAEQPPRRTRREVQSPLWTEAAACRFFAFDFHLDPTERSDEVTLWQSASRRERDREREGEDVF